MARRGTCICSSLAKAMDRNGLENLAAGVREAHREDRGHITAGDFPSEWGYKAPPGGDQGAGQTGGNQCRTRPL